MSFMLPSTPAVPSFPPVRFPGYFSVAGVMTDNHVVSPTVSLMSPDCAVGDWSEEMSLKIKLTRCFGDVT